MVSSSRECDFTINNKEKKSIRDKLKYCIPGSDSLISRLIHIVAQYVSVRCCLTEKKSCIICVYTIVRE